MISPGESHVKNFAPTLTMSSMVTSCHLGLKCSVHSWRQLCFVNSRASLLPCFVSTGTTICDTCLSLSSHIHPPTSRKEMTALWSSRFHLAVWATAFASGLESRLLGGFSGVPVSASSMSCPLIAPFCTSGYTHRIWVALSGIRSRVRLGTPNSISLTWLIGSLTKDGCLSSFDLLSTPHASLSGCGRITHFDGFDAPGTSELS